MSSILVVRFIEMCMPADVRTFRDSLGLSTAIFVCLRRVS